MFWILTNLLDIYIIKQTKTHKAMTTQENLYKVIYSDGVTELDYFTASNLTEAKQIAKSRSKNYKTAYYKVARCYNGGVRGSSNQTNWH